MTLTNLVPKSHFLGLGRLGNLKLFFSIRFLPLIERGFHPYLFFYFFASSGKNFAEKNEGCLSSAQRNGLRLMERRIEKKLNKFKELLNLDEKGRK